MKQFIKMFSLILALCLAMTAVPFAFAEDEVIDADLTCTITLGNWPPDTAADAEKALFEGYKATMAKQYPNVTLVPDYYSYSLSNYVPMAKGHTAPSIFQPPFTDPQLLISQGLVGDVTDALAQFGVLDQFSPSYVEMLADENGRIYGLPRDGYVLGMHINIDLFREAGLMTEDGLPMYPKTLQEMAEYGQIIKEKTGKAGLVFPASETYGGWLFTNIAWNFGCVGDETGLIEQHDGYFDLPHTDINAVPVSEFPLYNHWSYDRIYRSDMIKQPDVLMFPAGRSTPGRARRAARRAAPTSTWWTYSPIDRCVPISGTSRSTSAATLPTPCAAITTSPATARFWRMAVQRSFCSTPASTSAVPGAMRTGMRWTSPT